MNDEEYANMEQMEAAHWYYAGKREIVGGWLRRIGPPRPDQVLLDCGAGTGRFAKEMEAQCRVLVLDDHEEALRRLRARFRPEQVLSLTAAGIPLPAASLDFVTALDVLEHTPDDRAVVDGFHRLLKPGGWALVTVPASMALWSDWDEALHHFRRYSRPDLRALFPSPQWEVRHLNYTNVAVYPGVWLLRKWRRWFPARAGGPRAEDRQPSPVINAMLRRLFVAPAFWRVPLPFGVSLLLVARKCG
ncbi:MAG: class I SAM-dependent methyltransferase [Opitutaceae bacterium]|nr:class I SAM-dependent methyltransferase [Opitutaceae bacterium]